jgi:transketolase
MTPEDMKQAFPNAIMNVGDNDERVVVLVGDIGHFALKPFAEKCPGRYYNIGILEPTIVSMAAGLSAKGFYPVVHTITPFITERSLEQVKLDFCYQGLGGNLICVGSAFDYSTLGSTHHAYNDMATIGSIPGTEIIYPASPFELEELFKQTYNNGNLTYMRMARHPHGVEFDKIEFGKGIMVRKGSDITLIATGPQLKTVLDAAEQLDKNGVNSEVLYFHTVKPFDSDLVVESVSKTKAALVVEEHISIGGLEHYVRMSLNNRFKYILKSLCIPQEFLRHYGTYDEHCEAMGFTVENVCSLSNKILVEKLL